VYLRLHNFSFCDSVISYVEAVLTFWHILELPLQSECEGGSRDLCQNAETVSTCDTELLNKEGQQKPQTKLFL